MNRVEFQRWLDQFPEDTVIEVLEQQSPPNYESFGECRVVQFRDQETCEADLFDYVDFVGNRFVNPEDSHFGKRFLTLGYSE